MLSSQDARVGFSNRLRASFRCFCRLDNYRFSFCALKASFALFASSFNRFSLSASVSPIGLFEVKGSFDKVSSRGREFGSTTVSLPNVTEPQATHPFFGYAPPGNRLASV